MSKKRNTPTTTYTEPKFVIYRRVSTNEQGKSGLGLESQSQLLDHYLGEYPIVAEFVEVGSAKNMERPELKKAIELCKANGYHLAVAKVDRLSRRTEDALKVWDELEQRLFCANLPMSPADKCDKFMLTVFMAIADRERELISIRTKQALDAKRERGEKMGTPENLTTEAQRKGSQAQKEQAMAYYAHLADTIQMYQERGLSLRKIATELNKHHTTTNGKQFTAATVSRIIKRINGY